MCVSPRWVTGFSQARTLPQTPFPPTQLLAHPQFYSRQLLTCLPAEDGGPRGTSPGSHARRPGSTLWIRQLNTLPTAARAGQCLASRRESQAEAALRMCWQCSLGQSLNTYPRGSSVPQFTRDAQGGRWTNVPLSTLWGHLSCPTCSRDAVTVTVTLRRSVSPPPQPRGVHEALTIERC